MSSIASLADVLRIESVPLSERSVPQTPYEMLRQGASLAPTQPALSFFLDAERFDRPHVWTHEALFRKITQAANLFRSLGIERKDVLAFVLPNLPETHFVIWGGEAAGIVFAINPLLESEQIAELLNAAEARWVITLEPTPGTDLWQKATAAARKVDGLRGILTVGLGSYVSGARGLALKAMSRMRKSRLPGLDVPVLDFNRTLCAARDDQLDFQPPEPGQIASYFCTGGTTGLPKIATRTHFSEAFDAWAMSIFVEGGFAPGRTIFCGLPLFHVNGQLVTGLAPLGRGAHVVMGTPQGYRGAGLLARFWAIVEHYRINAFSGVPTVFSALLQTPIGSHDVSSLDFALCGAAPMPQALFRSFVGQTGIRILEAYGLTEGACASSANPPSGSARIGSIGLRFPYQDMRVLIVDDDGSYLRDAAPEEVGVLAIHGANVFAGYLDPRHNQGIWIDRDGARWLNTGDMARQDSDGYFWLTGRKKELIIRGGHNIDPALIEAPLHTHPAVALAAAIGRPDAHSGEVPVAYVQLKPGASATPEELMAFAMQNVHERAAWPKHVRVLEVLPVTAVGKIFKPALSMREIEDVVRGHASATDTELITLDVFQHPQRGLLAKMQAGRNAEALKQALSAYTFAMEIAS
ncbi:acyl-CoA synthetase [Variovorax sp. Root411]|uniref:acyl-CoA synthetase n=1 Tax=Variovorax sp. Root411 TaxID=1736530 RepID=UPI0006F50A92|nr:acyl-CoA synthetase [Variovorax sp. Root411]KQW64915.1 acyl-CoA synthetase [Variovorax sp. Root411]